MKNKKITPFIQWLRKMKKLADKNKSGGYACSNCDPETVKKILKFFT